MRANQVAWKERHEAYMGRLRWFATRLDAAADGNPVARAVCDLHSQDKLHGDAYCTWCDGGEYGEYWPCDTIKAVAVALNVEVPAL